MLVSARQSSMQFDPQRVYGVMVSETCKFCLETKTADEMHLYTHQTTKKRMVSRVCKDCHRLASQRASRPEPRPREVRMIEGTVYFIAALDAGLIKIGFTRQSVEDRIKTIAGQSPLPLCAVASKPGSTIEEARVHKLLATSNAHHEWFHADNTVRQFIIDNCDVIHAQAFADVFEKKGSIRLAA